MPSAKCPWLLRTTKQTDIFLLGHLRQQKCHQMHKQLLTCQNKCHKIKAHHPVKRISESDLQGQSIHAYPGQCVISSVLPQLIWHPTALSFTGWGAQPALLLINTHSHSKLQLQSAAYASSERKAEWLPFNCTRLCRISLSVSQRVITIIHP